MPSTNSVRVPAYRKHKGTGQAVVTLNGKDRYLGRYGTAVSKTAYQRLLSEWLAHGGQLPVADHSLTVNEVILPYWRHVQSYYRKNGRPTSEPETIKQALKPLKELYGDTPAKDFGPLGLAAVRQRMIETGWCRSYVNKQVVRVRRAFKYAASQEMIPPDVFHGLQTVDGLHRGRSEARESKAVKPVPESIIDATIPFLSPPIKAMVELQLLTAMRPGEVVIMRACDLETSGTVWIYRPESHKTEHHDRERTIYLGPRAQEIVKPWLKTDLTAYLFSAAEMEELRNAERKKNRKSPMTPSQAKRKRQRNRQYPWGEHYSSGSYRRTIARACEAAFPPPADLPADQVKQWRKDHNWHPHQLRHNAATRLRKEYGIELARIVCGHSSMIVTQIYAEADSQQAMEVIGKVG